MNTHIHEKSINQRPEHIMREDQIRVRDILACLSLSFLGLDLEETSVGGGGVVAAEAVVAVPAD